jgi:hypothetical protein
MLELTYLEIFCIAVIVSIGFATGNGIFKFFGVILLVIFSTIIGKEYQTTEIGQMKAMYEIAEAIKGLKKE